MIKYLAKFETVVEGRVGHFLVDHDLDITLAEKMAMQFLNYIQQVKENAKKAQEVPPVVEQTKQEVPIGN